MREPETPGGFKLSMAWRPVSRSVTAEAMVLGRSHEPRFEYMFAKGLPSPQLQRPGQGTYALRIARLILGNENVDRKKSRARIPYVPTMYVPLRRGRRNASLQSPREAIRAESAERNDLQKSNNRDGNVSFDATQVPRKESSVY